MAEGSEDERGYSLVMRGELDLGYKNMAEEALSAGELAAGGAYSSSTSGRSTTADRSA
jgi:hypothetical protein